MTNQEAIELAIRACEKTWNEKTCKQIKKALEQEPSVEILKTEESNDNGTKYLNINVSDAEVKRNPDIVRLCSDVGILEYAKPKTGHWIESNIPNEKYVCSECGGACWYYDYQGDVAKSRYCPNCGTKMESEDKE